VDWPEASLADLRLLRSAIRRDWTLPISARRKRRIIEGMSAIIRRDEAGPRLHIAAARAMIEADAQNMRIEQEAGR
jgi:hypothetical protein